MPLPTLAVKTGGGGDATINVPNSGRQAANDSQAVVLSTEDLAVLNNIMARLPAAFDRGRLGVALAGRGVTYTDRSGTIATAGSAQELAAANAARTGLTLQNTSSGDLRVSSRGAASASAGILIKSGDLYTWPAHGTPVGAISIWGAASGQSFEAMEW
ncbi:MAG: hypothetical protein WCO82_11730 [Sphingomonadales bacterium]|jgi:hypothetical protein